MRRGIAIAAVVVAGCGGRKEPAPHAARDDAATAALPAPIAATPDAGAEACEPLAFAETIPVPEASGSALMPIDGVDALLVIGDSGNHGAYVIVDPATGAERETGQLPLGKSKSDDLEGLAVRDGVIVAITSSGYILTWTRAGTGFALADGPYPLADHATGLACDEGKVNCGKNYEGICLRSGAIPAGECAGLAASKTDGRLYCLVVAGARLAATDRSIPISAPETLTGCDIAPDGSVWAGTNLFGRSTIYRVTGWTTPESAVVHTIGTYGVGFPESIAAGPDDVIYRFSDLGTAPSAVAKFRCRDPER